MSKAELLDTLEDYGTDVISLRRRVMLNHEEITGVEIIPACQGRPEYINISTQ